MTSKTTYKFSPEVRDRAVRMVLDHAGEHPSRWAAVTSIAAKIGCTPQTLHAWVKKAEIDSGQRTGDRRDDLQTNPPTLTRRLFPAQMQSSAVFASEPDRDHWNP
ncbi:transposase-like protein [Bradyrhizobium sp. JR4.1]|uniref:transposase n=1 Tax=Bradyrhizobium sp. JR4.1 TaxID=3156372 RepID=UPI00339B92D2